MPEIASGFLMPPCQLRGARKTGQNSPLPGQNDAAYRLPYSYEPDNHSSGGKKLPTPLGEKR
jgi:hypothetical protein